MEKKLRKSRTYLLWTREPADKPPATATPTDVLHLTNTRITVANPSGWKNPAKPKELVSTAQWYKTSAPTTTHLIGNITMILEDDDISSMVHRKSIFEFASDGVMIRQQASQRLAG
jgi:hypothetical protein